MVSETRGASEAEGTVDRHAVASETRGASEAEGTTDRHAVASEADLPQE